LLYPAKIAAVGAVGQVVAQHPNFIVVNFGYTLNFLHTIMLKDNYISNTILCIVSKNDLLRTKSRQHAVALHLPD